MNVQCVGLCQLRRVYDFGLADQVSSNKSVPQARASVCVCAGVCERRTSAGSHCRTKSNHCEIIVILRFRAEGFPLGPPVFLSFEFAYCNK